MSEAREHLSVLRCPRCGADANEGVIRYVETIEAWRAVRGVDRGVLRIESAYRSGEGYDDGRGGMFERHSARAPSGWCGHRWRTESWVMNSTEFD